MIVIKNWNLFTVWYIFSHPLDPIPWDVDQIHKVTMAGQGGSGEEFALKLGGAHRGTCSP